jgi:hypothetical protein
MKKPEIIFLRKMEDWVVVPNTGEDEAIVTPNLEVILTLPFATPLLHRIFRDGPAQLLSERDLKLHDLLLAWFGFEIMCGLPTTGSPQVQYIGLHWHPHRNQRFDRVILSLFVPSALLASVKRNTGFGGDVRAALQNMGYDGERLAVWTRPFRIPTAGTHPSIPR